MLLVAVADGSSASYITTHSWLYLLLTTVRPYSVCVQTNTFLSFPEEIQIYFTFPVLGGVGHSHTWSLIDPHLQHSSILFSPFFSKSVRSLFAGEISMSLSCLVLKII